MKEGAVKLDSARPKTVIIVVPVVLIVVPPAIIIKRREVALRGRAAVVAVRTKVAQPRRPSVVAVVIVGPLARVRALDGRRVRISSPAVGAIRALLAHGSQEVIIIITVAIIIIPVPAVVVVIIAVEPPIIVVEDLPVFARTTIVANTI